MKEEKNIHTNSEVLVKVEGLSKKFCKDLKTSLWYGVKDLTANVFGNKNVRQLRDKEFWAVKDINFELRRGECLGLIGHNGAGKSTLLKILNGLINPDEGKVTIRGRVGALIELGAGFNPILSGRENIYNNGAVLGFSKKEIDEKVEAIIDFSEIREFIDMPVQNYSSGMKVRLGFAVAAQMEPDVLIIDEVLAVGDIGFAMKSFNAISQILKTSAVIFVSHSMPFISRICDNIILMDKGKMLLKTNDVGFGVQSYFDNQKLLGALNFGEENIILNNVKIHSENPRLEGIIEYGKKSIFEINIDSLNDYPKVKVSILVYNMAQINVALFESRYISIKSIKGQKFIFDFGDSFLSISNYFITVRFDDLDNKKALVVSNYVNYRSFQVTGAERLVFAPLYLKEKI
ncbi:ABC transporter ATP-binding protein [Tamlana haliotis]|uniref:ABC transporter ATP-binding protein n=1 Tax=Pseudotamlana haliotis TaxID=2614804 RepID=A0A6N6MCI1_9FLAO|nr:ABC transporter ATP-binding protein [Tamlana haliotis]KAB1067015.1 ABC transporter ATP-binding protein [Tamlana haliotis]